jgi:hypothetical protein
MEIREFEEPEGSVNDRLPETKVKLAGCVLIFVVLFIILGIIIYFNC